MERNKYGLIIIGSGPGGYVAAIRAAQLKMKVAIIEKESLGGVCLNWGCIPTKSLLKSAQVFQQIQKSKEYGIEVKDVKIDFEAIISRSRKIAHELQQGVQFLCKKYHITVINGTASLIDQKTVQVKNLNNQLEDYYADHIILATGSTNRALPLLPINHSNVIGYREAMNLKKQPKKMVIIGGGAIGIEFAYFYQALGTQVILVELKQKILPQADHEISKELASMLEQQGVQIYTETKLTKADIQEDSCKLMFSNSKKSQILIQTDVVLVAIGITPNTSNIGIEKVGVKLNKHQQVEVDTYYQTNIPNIYAIGDLIAGPALAHVASAEGILCVEKIAGLKVTPINYDEIPSCVYSQPEVASVGYTESKAKELGYELKIGKFPFSASGKARTANQRKGFVKMIFDAKYGELLGAHMIGDQVVEMIAEIVVAKKLETTADELLDTIHPHPTMSEAILEATMQAYGKGIHF